ncbi:hypothetical protein EHM69_01365 [candidate division KSB1 bacterium]|nr:MAG: hypothetical protein EHM69_01365 [candidate division KSB1 bacterium]
MNKRLSMFGYSPSSVTCLPYDLPDAPLLEPSAEAARCMVFVPSGIMVVIGKGSDPALELNKDTILADGIPVLRRGTGGCAVVLTRDMMAVSFSISSDTQLKSSEYFRLFNETVIRALKAQGISGLHHAGTSDIALENRKIAGTAIYRNRNLIFYHAIINVAGNTDLIERYLSIPPRLPAYREGRRHSDFVTSLQAAGYQIRLAEFQKDVEREFAATLRHIALLLSRVSVK